MPLALESHGSCCKISAGFISELVRRITAVTLDRRGCNVKQADMTRACKTGVWVPLASVATPQQQVAQMSMPRYRPRPTAIQRKPQAEIIIVYVTNHCYILLKQPAI